MRRLAPPLPELCDMCHHFDGALPCGIDGRPCIGHKEDVWVPQPRGKNKKITIAKYKHTPMVPNPYGTGQVEGEPVMCPKLRRILYDEPELSALQSETQVD